MQQSDQRQGGHGPQPGYGAQPGMYNQQRPAAGMPGQPGPAQAQALPRPPMQPQLGGFRPSGPPSGPLQRPPAAAFSGMTLSNGPPQGALPRPPGMRPPGQYGQPGPAAPQSNGALQPQPPSSGPSSQGSYAGPRPQPAGPPGGFQQPQARPGYGVPSQQAGPGYSMPRGPPLQRPSFPGPSAQRPLAPGQPGPGPMQPPGPGLANGHAMASYGTPPPQSGQLRPAFMPSPPSPQPTSIGFGRQPGQYGPSGQQMSAQRPMGPPPGMAPQFRGRPPAPGMPGGVPSFGAGPDSILPGGRAMAAPLGGGEYVQDNRRSPSRIEPHSMPRPGTDLTAAPVVFCTRDETNQHAVPPPASSNYIVNDRGDCSPRCMRATLNSVPVTSDLWKLGAMPMAVVISPLALPDPMDDAIQVVDPGPEGPVRCSECKAYMNPHMIWLDAGRKFACTFCGSTTQTPHDYVENTGPDGRRRDADERPELSCGSYEFVAGPQFQVRPPMLPTHVFLIDVSHTAILSGATAAACVAITSILDDLQGEERQHVGVVTFDSAIHFFSFNADRSGYHMLVVSDGEQPYAPAASSSLVVPLQAAIDTVKSLLGQIPELFKASNAVDTCLGGAVEACIQLLKGGTGGKLQVFASVLPKVGKAPLTPRDQAARSMGDKDVQKVQEPANKAYRDMAADAAEFQVCIDLFITSQGYVDLATLRDLCHLTAGQLYHYQPFSAALDTDQLTNDLRWNVVRPQGWEAVGRLRMSTGLDIERYSGSFFRRTTSDMDFPALSADHSFAIQLRHDGSLSTGRPVLLQYALVYSTASGHRRIRVHTMALPAVDKLGPVFRGADLEASLSVLAVNMAAKIPNGTLASAKEMAAKTMIDVLHSYRKNCSTQSSPGQLVLPEALKLAPLYHLCLQKCPAFRPDSLPDTRALWLHRLTSLPVARLMNLVHGALLPLHDLLDAAAAGEPIGQGPDIIPKACAGLTAEKLREDGVFLWMNGSEAILFFGQRVPPPLIHATIGQDTVDVRSNVEALRWPLGVPKLDTPPNRALQAVLDELRRLRGAYMFLRVARRGDAVESAFYSNLIEDKTSAGTSYVDFLVAVHRRIADLNK